MGLNVRKMENGTLYEILDDWYVVKFKGNLFSGSTIFVYGFENDKIISATYGKLAPDDEYDNYLEFMIKGWRIQKDTPEENDYLHIGERKTANVYRFAKLGLNELEPSKEVMLKKEILYFWFNPKKYFDEQVELNEDNKLSK